MDHQLKKNVLSLTILQIGNYLVPLLILPHLTRVLGVDGFGQIGFATAFTMYFVLLVEWGFNLSATHRISVKRSDPLARSLVFWETISARTFLTVLGAIILGILILAVPKLNNISLLLWLGVMQVLGSTISPSFYYQGLEKMSGMALVNLAVRSISVPLIIFFISRPDQVIDAFAIQTGCFFLASVINFLLLMRSGAVAMVRPKYIGIKNALIEGFPLFLSFAGTSLYTNSNAVILGFVSSEAAVGYFVAGFTLVKAVVGLSGPFGQAIFPRISHHLTVNRASAGSYLKKMIFMNTLLGGALSLGLLIFLPWGVTWFYGASFSEAIPVVAWLSILPFIICLASSLGMQTLLPLGRGRWFTSILLLGGLVNCILILPLGYMWGAWGAAAAVLIAECVILLGMALGVRRLEPEIWKSMVAYR